MKAINMKLEDIVKNVNRPEGHYRARMKILQTTLSQTGTIIIRVVGKNLLTGLVT